MGQKSKLKDILTRMEQLLRRVRAYGQAEYLNTTLEILKHDEDAARSRLTGMEVWGGAGSFIDYEIGNYSEHVSDDVRGDNIAYYSLLLELLKYLSEFGYSKRRVASLTKMLESDIRYWSSLD